MGGRGKGQTDMPNSSAVGFDRGFQNLSKICASPFVAADRRSRGCDSGVPPRIFRLSGCCSSVAYRSKQAFE